MPIPSPRKNEKQNDFISRCMHNFPDDSNIKDNSQRVAVCYTQWKKTHKSKNNVALERLEDDILLKRYQNQFKNDNT